MPTPMDLTSVEVPQEADEGTWVDAEVGEFAAGDRVRVISRGLGDVDEGIVIATSCSTGEGDPALVVRKPDGVESCRHARYRNYQRWVPAHSSPTWAPITDPTTLTAGDYVRGTAVSDGAVVEGRFDRLTSNGRIMLAGMVGQYFTAPEIRRWERLVETPDPGGTWVRTEAADFEVGDRVRVTHRRSGTVHEGTVREVQGGGWLSVDHGATEEAFSAVYRTFEKWAPATPASSPTPSPAPAVREVPIPEWATSLDAAKRHVHAQARRLYRRGDNCYDGSSDFVGGLDLPDVNDDYPAPEVVDESAQIREFLTKVREVALHVARDHGKSISLVERWLNEQGIVEPPPTEVRHTVTFTAPADANVQQILRDLGWEVQA